MWRVRRRGFGGNADAEVGNALLAQSVVAGIGNVYKSEVCFACGVNPFRTGAQLKRGGNGVPDDYRAKISAS